MIEYKRYLIYKMIVFFLWGARQVGKSTLVKKLFPDAKVYDLLKSDEYSRLLRKPQLLREELVSYDETKIVIIDEIQKIPSLLDEVHWLIVNRGYDSYYVGRVLES